MQSPDQACRSAPGETAPGTSTGHSVVICLRVPGDRVAERLRIKDASGTRVMALAAEVQP